MAARRAAAVLAALLVLVPGIAAGAGAAAIATAHPQATDAGIAVLGQGGNAFDAAVAVAATLAVVEPFGSGIGGGGFWLLYRARDQRYVFVDGREVAPGAADARMYLDAGGAVVAGRSIDGPLAAAIPGTPAALVHVAEHYGRLPLARTLAPAIAAARDGFEVTAHYRRLAQLRLAALRAAPEAAAVFLVRGEVPAAGLRIRQPQLADTLTRLARHGHAGFYEGELAQRLVAGVRDAGGIWTHEDLRAYRVIEREPLHGRFRGARIVTAPPPSAGGVALLTMLNVLDAGEPPRSAVLGRHLLIEAMRRAYRDRAEFLGDPDFAPVPVARLTGRAHAEALRRSIRLDAATASATLAPAGSSDGGWHTTHFSIQDGEGNRVAATLSLNYPFGSGFMPPGTGVLLNDEMDDFAIKPGVANVYGLVGGDANAIAPGKRMLSSMTPTFVETGDRVAILGTPGGSRIITTVLHALLAVVDGQAAEDIVRAPRFHHQYLPDVVQYEPGAFSWRERRQLRRLGHSLRRLDEPYGNLQVVVFDRRRGELTAASDPRGEGAARVAAAPCDDRVSGCGIRVPGSTPEGRAAVGLE